VAGQNKVFKEGDMVFRQGDPADCMYLVRKGSLRVLIEKEEGDVTLATLDAGAIVGEMAFFDNKPRSATVKATQSTEVTQITKTDFDKLLTQIPKWMVTMMQSLSGRLRTTNERLQKLETTNSASSAAILPNQKYPFQIFQKTLRSILLSHAKDGEKEGREHVVRLDACKELWVEIVNEDAALFDRIVAKVTSFGLIAIKKNPLKQDVISFTNRGGLVQLTELLARLGPKFTATVPFLETSQVELFQALVDEGIQSGYEAINISILDISATQKRKGKETSSWSTGLMELAKRLDLKLSKGPNSVLVKIVPKEHKVLRTIVDQMAEIARDKLH
jgi:hypothetical protein